MFLKDLSITRKLPISIFFVLSAITYPLYAAGPGESAEMTESKSSVEQQQTESMQNEPRRSQLLPPPPPGPYHSMAFKRDRSGFRQPYRGAQAPNPGSRQAAPSAQRTPVPQTAGATQREPQQARVERYMDMYSPDRPWPKDIRPEATSAPEHRAPGNTYRPVRPSFGTDAPDFEYGGNYAPRPGYGAPLPPAYPPKMYFQGRNLSDQARRPAMYNNSADRVPYSAPADGR